MNRYQLLFHKTLDNAPHAMADVMVTMKNYFD